MSLLPADLSASSFPEEFTAWYKASKGMFSGETIVSVKADKDHHYLYESVTKVTGMMSIFGGEILEKSVWEYADGKIRPLRYSYNRSLGSKKRNAELTFDWNKKIVTNSIDSQPWKMTIKPDTLDKLVYQLVMMNDLQQGNTELNYSIADGGKLKDYKISIMGEETIKTKIGEFKTIKVARIRGKRTTTMWCAEKLGYLPVRIHQKKNGGGEHTAEIYRLEGFENL